MPTEPLERLMRFAESEAKRDRGGLPPVAIEALCHRFGLELRATLKRERLDVNQQYTVEMVAVGLAVQLACEVLFRERKMARGDKNWFTGFGNKSTWTTQNGTNGKH